MAPSPSWKKWVKLTHGDVVIAPSPAAPTFQSQRHDRRRFVAKKAVERLKFRRCETSPLPVARRHRYLNKAGLSEYLTSSATPPHGCHLHQPLRVLRRATESGDRGFISPLRKATSKAASIRCEENPLGAPLVVVMPWRAARREPHGRADRQERRKKRSPRHLAHAAGRQ